MLSKFRKKHNKASLGLDISSSTVKLVELVHTDQGYELQGYAVVALPVGAVEEKSIRDIEAVGQAIANALAQCPGNTKLTVAAVSGASVITKLIDMDADLTDDQLEAQIELDAEQYIPYPREEIALDFSVLGPSPAGENQNEVLLAACRRENIDMRVDAMELAGLEPRVVDVEAYALQRAVNQLAEQYQLGDDKVVAVIDIGASAMTLSIIHEGETQYSREQLFGGSQLVNEVRSRYDKSVDEAVHAIKFGGLPDDYNSEVLIPFRELVVQQVGRSLQFFYSSSAYQSVDFILLAGGVAAIEGLDRLVEEKLAIATAVANPFAKMRVASGVKKANLTNDAPALMVACGLAMRRVG